ncbi:MAG: hypothetical protein NTW87_31980 [Planctomycetota bacterium]|nr:hypothetical protein [Planctomycetota bacterium]
MARPISLLMLVLALGPAVAGEVPRLGEQDLKLAHVQAEEGDLHAAVLLWFRILRQADTKELRDEAREQLEHTGLSGQDIFQLDPAALKPADWEKLLTRLTAAAAQQQRQELDFDYAQGLLRAAVALCVDPAGKVKVEIQSKDLARALDLMVQLALSETDGEQVRKAQSELEHLGIVGPQVAALRKTMTDGKLPVEVQNELVCGVCLQRLHRYQEWLQEREEHDDSPARKQVAKKLGANVYKFLATNLAQTAAFKRSSEILDFWRDLANPAEDKAF